MTLDLDEVEKACAQARPSLSCAHAVMKGQLCADCWKLLGEVPALVAEVRDLREGIAELHAYIDEAKAAMGNDRVTGEPLAQAIRALREHLHEVLELRDERLQQYEEDVEEVNELLDKAGLHVGSSDLSTLVRQLIADADNGREASRAARAQALERAAKVALAYMDTLDRYESPMATAGNIAAAIRTLGAK